MKKGKKLILLLVFTIVLIQFFSSSGLMINGTESITNEVSKKSLVINTIAPETIKANKDASHEQSTAAFTTIGNGFQTNDNTGNNTTSSNKKIDKKQVIVKYRDVSKAEETKSKFASKKPSRKLISKKSFKNFKLETLEISEFEDVENIIKELQGDSNIEYAQPDYLLDINLFPQDERFAEQWALLNNGQTINGQVGISQIDINAVNAWDITKGSKNVTVAVVDTDIDIDHTDLDGNIFVNIKEQLNGLDDDGNGYIDDINGWDVVNNDSSVFDTEAYEMHGTHVSGIIAAKHNNGGIAGVSPDVNILPIKFINGSVGYSSDAIAAIEYAVSMGASIINCSWGGSEYNQALKDVMENSNALFVCAAGNSARNTDVNPIYPACFDLPNIISVGAFDNKGEIAVFSNYGSKIHVAAPGVDILSTLPGNKYGLMSGTSMAAPYVSGVAALLNSKENVLSAQSLKARIMDNVTKVQNLIGKVSTSGRINMEAALLNSTPSEIAQPTAESIPTESPITTELVNMNVGIVKMEFDKTSAAVGDIITATLKVEGVNYFSGSQVNIKYDPAVVQPVDNNLQPYNENTRPAGGNILINNDYSPISYASNDLSRGILNFCNGYIDLLGYKEGAIAETFGTLAVIKFKVLSNNQIQIKFENTERMPGSVSAPPSCSRKIPFRAYNF
jgi:subtilisin family serine protease